jgi:hypothetical protein
LTDEGVLEVQTPRQNNDEVDLADPVDDTEGRGANAPKIRRPE